MPEEIGYLGPEGTFTEMAVMELFPGSQLKQFATIFDCLEAVDDKTVDYGVVPLENTIEGSVNMTLDYLCHQSSISIVGELTLPIRQHLLIHPNYKDRWHEIEEVHSHPHAIAQAHEFLRRNLPGAKLVHTTSTGKAAKLVKETDERVIGAIGNELAATHYGLAIASSDIHDYENNHTRFVVLTKEGKTLSKKDALVGHKVTLQITLPSDYPGALYQVLAAFAWRKLNLSKIESRPMKTGLGNYFFIIDILSEPDNVLLQGVKNELEALGTAVKVLGEYPCYSVEHKVE
ncbi:prephenate dehydratase [Pseudalkalibacillus caeni]|uniref:Prephenate dehydratase n=1 Tax=Exobacillus caeni TaxID=2574798 RepID=A0A5R9FI47_9BACL|nr:prephenate dehydratase [Pseudalkalibacillus caeni]TLS39255.1 prephenate dehydratase [Pseudalkalibacillus caeni]